MLKMSARVYENICATVGNLTPECGGVLGGITEGVVTDYYFDEHGKSSINGYTPNVDEINKVLINEWKPMDIKMLGIVHSHSNGIAVPSCGDINYGIRILEALDHVNKFYIPIVVTTDGSVKMEVFSISRDNERKYVCKKEEYEIAN